MSSTYIPVELRRLVAARAPHLCEYCLLHEDDTFFGCEVDHIISEKHGGFGLAVSDGITLVARAEAGEASAHIFGFNAVARSLGRGTRNRGHADTARHLVPARHSQTSSVLHPLNAVHLGHDLETPRLDRGGTRRD